MVVHNINKDILADYIISLLFIDGNLFGGFNLNLSETTVKPMISNVENNLKTFS